MKEEGPPRARRPLSRVTGGKIKGEDTQYGGGCCELTNLIKGPR